jgi:hypothetical protein
MSHSPFDPINNFLTFVLMHIVAFYFSYTGYFKFRRFLQLRDTPMSKTSSAAQGTVKLQGFAWPSKELFAPVSGSRVVYYECEVHKITEDNTEIVAQKKSALPFFLMDATGLVQISPGKSKVEFDIGNSTEYDWSDLPAEKKKALTKKLDAKEQKKLEIKWWENVTKMKVKERYISEKSQISAFGNFKSKFSNFETQVKPLDGVAIFMNTLTKGYDVTRNLDDAKVPIHGQIKDLNFDNLLIADCWQDRLLNRLNGPYKSFAMMAVGGLIIVVMYTMWYLDWISRHSDQ